MILIDPRSGPEAQKYQTTVDRMVGYVKANHVPCEKSPLEFGDLAFEGNGPVGKMMIGIERKSLHDLLHCIDDARFTGHQKVGMGPMYGVSFLMVEGVWRPHDPEGWLMELYSGSSWGKCRYRTQQVLYSKVFRYLLSVSLSNVIVTYSRDLWHTCYNTCEMYHYFQKKWEDHTSLLEIPKLLLPDMRTRPPLVRKWAADIEAVGVKMSLTAEEIFKTPHALANSEEMDWLRIPRIGVATARKIIKEIRGW